MTDIEEGGKISRLKNMPKVFIGVGANLGDRAKSIQQARDLLGSVRGIRFLACSAVRETDPQGGPPQEKYLNTVSVM